MNGNEPKTTQTDTDMKDPESDPITVVIHRPMKLSPYVLLLPGMAFVYASCVVADRGFVEFACFTGLISLSIVFAGCCLFTKQCQYRKRLSTKSMKSHQDPSLEESMSDKDDQDLQYGTNSSYAQVVEALIGLRRVHRKLFFMSIYNKYGDSDLDQPKLKRELEKRGYALPRIIIVEYEAHDAIRTIDRRPVLYEPEPIKPTGNWWLSDIELIIPIAMLLLVVSAVVEMILVLYIGFVFWAIIILCKVSYSRVTILGGCAVLGMGVISDTRERIWTVCDTVTYINRTTVTLVGQNRNILFRFGSLRSRVFGEFWCRWNHPNPRPELLVEGYEKPEVEPTADRVEGKT